MENRNGNLNLFRIVAWLFIAAHGILLILCYIAAPITIFFVQNILGILYFLGLLYVGSHFYRNIDNLVFVTVIVLWVQLLISFLAVGVKGGFQIMSFGTLLAAFFLISPSKGRTRLSLKPIVVEIGSVGLYLGLMVLSRFIEPWYILEDSDLHFVSFTNALAVLVQLLLFSYVYRMRLNQSVTLLQKQADYDELTGLLNRLGMRHVFDSFAANWKNNAVPYAVAIFDIDDFKQVNDTWGHAAGDMVLKTIAQILHHFQTEKSAVCRWGGEEFMVAGQIRINLATFFEDLEMISEQIASYEFQWNGEVFHVTVTCGVAVIESDMPIHELIDKADHRLYAGKSNGKNQVVMFD